MKQGHALLEAFWCLLVPDPSAAQEAPRRSCKHQILLSTFPLKHTYITYSLSESIEMDKLKKLKMGKHIMK
jgi:hypothetical protein